MDLDANLRRYLDGGIGSGGRKPNERYASFGYCFNYFQSFRELGNISALAGPANVQPSCIQLGFYLASWGMLRGSAELLQKSARQLVPIIEVVAGTDASFSSSRCWKSLLERKPVIEPRRVQGASRSDGSLSQPAP